jgi:DNA-binding transcriptional ArsR family regulator
VFQVKAMTEISKPFNPDEMRQKASEATSLLKCLASEHRLVMLCVLSEGELSVGELNRRVGLSQSSLSQHLAVLRERGLVATRRESQTIYYSLADTPALELIHVLHDRFCP